MRSHAIRFGVVTVIASAALWGSSGIAAAGGGCMHSTGPTTGRGDAVEMLDYCFTSTVLYVERGTDVTWTNRDDRGHNIVCVGGTWGNPDLTLNEGDTASYRFDEDGISMRWGILFRREIHLTYTRIQDIHLTSNLIERWLGLARIQVQTASGSSAAEMTLEGIKAYELVRDFIYSKMRGHTAVPATSQASAAADGSELAEVAASLREVSRELRALRQELDRRDGRGV